MKILYFAWLRSRTGIGEENVDLPENVRTVGDLVNWLKARGSNYETAFADMRAVRAAVNQTYVPFDQVLSNDDEVAFFPPVTGG